MQKKSADNSSARNLRPKKRAPQTRRAAGNMLSAIERGKTLDEAMDRLDGLSPANRGLAHAMVMLALRHRGEITALLSDYLKRAIPPRPHIAKALLHLGAVQICYMDTPDHAAVAETVNACGRQEGPYRGLINAVLRKLSKQSEAARTLPDDATLNAPDWMMAQWTKTYGQDQATLIAKQHRQQPPLDLCFKTAEAAQIAIEAFVTLQTELKAENISPTHVRLWGAPHVEDLPGFKIGDWWVQDVAAGFPAYLLMQALKQTPLTSGAGRAHVLDLCAAPGGKTMQLAAAGYRVTALDISKTRLNRLRENLTRTKLTAEIIVADALDWQPDTPFDAILLDAPCSASGTIRRHPDLPLHRRPGYTAKLTTVQDALLARASQWLKSDGVMVYTTCSLDPAEGEERIENFRANHAAFSCLSISDAVPAELIKDSMLRTTPAHWAEKGGMDGFFAAVLKNAPVS